MWNNHKNTYWIKRKCKRNILYKSENLVGRFVITEKLYIDIKQVLKKIK